MGLLVVPPSEGERPYAKFASDGRRLWFACTEGHPRTYQPTSIRVGYVDPTGGVADASHRPLGRVGPGVPVTSIPYGYRAPHRADAWVSDIRFIGGRPAVAVSLRSGRINNASGTWKHEHLRVMPDPSGRWVRELVAQAGGELGGNQIEPDYSGLSSLDPTNHNRIVASTNAHPLTGVPLRSRADGRVHFELWEMAKATGGWGARPITHDSTVDNIRPHVAALGSTKIVSWMRGTYNTPYSFSTEVVARQAR